MGESDARAAVEGHGDRFRAVDLSQVLTHVIDQLTVLGFRLGNRAVSRSLEVPPAALSP
jgi:hypothetical protein